MTNEQKRMAVYNTIANYLMTLQQQNDISSTMMEDAINKYLVSLKDQIIQELLLQIPEEDERAVDDGQYINELPQEEDEDRPTRNHMGEFE